METVRFVYWQEGTWWLGYLEEFPEYWTQGESREELEEQLRDLHHELTSGQIPNVPRIGDLRIA
ncbi:MAG TPA: type II toxin-antitoxin system HicB family antitoxin [Thermoanaerobaculia bacterium]|nr:type II toxin-antitoxin system HicB family antitoxin [Thermoanaerobaculia bacterium]